ncbi:MAG: hypothetical protein EXS13_01970 [Planctomycetes bacterium]|nr:hypothetical protein [Planctomycetota bacterium]
MRRSAFAATAAAIVLLAVAIPALLANDDRAPLDEAPAPVRTALLDGDWNAALAQLDQAQAAAPEKGDLFTLLRGQVHLARHDAVAAEQAYAAVETRFPKTRWLAKARFGRAEALRDLRRFAEAEAIVASEATRLRSDARRDELLALALELADRALDPGPAGTPDTPAADPARALALYDQLLPLDPPDALRSRIQRQRGRALEKLNQHEAALTAFQAYLGSVAGKVLATETIDARLALARALRQLGRGGDARRALDALAAELGASADPALRTRVGDVLLAAARTWNDDSQRLLAAAALRRYLERAPGHPQRFEARLELAQLLADAGRTEESLAALGELLAAPGGDETATRLQAEAAYRRGRLLLAQGKCGAATAAFADAIARDPTGPRWAEAQAAMVEAEFHLAAVALERGDHPGARAALEQFIGRHPLDGRVAALRVQIGDLWLAEAQARRKEGATATATKDIDRAAIDQWQRVVRLHPASDAASESLYKAGALWHEQAELERAVEAWRACNFGGHAGTSAAELARLLQPSLAVTTLRSFRAGEPATLELRCRNLEQVTVKLHRLDLEAYFRKFLAADSVERLDLDLIAPEQSFQFAVPDYVRWKETLLALPLPIEGPGAWIAVVEAPQLRATTLVLKSDLDLIVKSSHRELLVYAEDRAQGTPAAGVELLLDVGADETGTRRQLTGTTDADGIVHLRADQPFEPAALRAFAKRAGSVAVTNVPLQGVVAPAAPTPRGLLFTDRPAYRPGQQVEACAFLREVEAGRLAVPSTKQWTLTVADPRGREVRRETLALDEFGTAATSFTLDALAPTGGWTLACTRDDGPTFRTQFLVADYELDRVKLDFELARRVYFRGEPIELVAQARWQHGAPVVDATVRFALPDGRLIDLVTDAQGRATTRFETADLPEERTLAFTATLLDGGIATSTQALLAIRELDLALSLPARAVLVDERFAVTATVTGRDGTPRAAEVKLSLLRRRDEGGEVLAQERKVAATLPTGRATLETALAEGGRYVVRAETTDRFGNPIAAEGLLLVAGKDDTQKLRLLADRTQLEAGESTRVRLVQRSGGGRVLLTWELADALRWRVFEAKNEIEELTIAADEALAPGFVLAAAAMRGTLLQTDAVAIDVTRALVLTVTPRATISAPGGEVIVDVEARDPLGKPVAARVALAVVDDALLRQFPDGTPPPERVFALEGKAPAPWRTASSCAFRYECNAAAIDAEVLAEGRRGDVRKQLGEVDLQMLSALGYANGDGGGGGSFGAPQSESADRFDEEEKSKDAVGHRGTGAPGEFAGRLGEPRLRVLSVGGKGGRAGTPGFDPDSGDASDTAWFAPDLTTGADGKASVTLRLPDRSTTWQLVARGITLDSRAAQARAELVARESFFAELRLPPQLTQGDAPRFMATLFHDGVSTGRAELRLRATIGGQVVSLPATLDLARGATIEHLFDALPAMPLVDSVELELTATVAGATPKTHRFVATLPVVPWGIERVAAQSGELANRTTFTLALPAAETFVARRLELLLAPSAPRLLLDDALDRTQPWQLAPCVLPQDSAATELLGACEVLLLARRLEEGQQASGVDVSALRQRVAGLVGRLIVAQQDDGGWPWAGGKGSDRATSAFAVLALERARAIGFDVPEATQRNGLTYLQQAFRAAGPQADELKALLQYALATSGQGDSAALQRLHRVRQSLTPAGLAYACLALQAAEKGPMAAELAALIEQRAAPSPAIGGCRWEATDNGRFHRSQLETSALSVLALSAATPTSPAIAQGVAFLLAQRPWAPERAAGLVRAALGRFYAAVAPEQVEALVRVRVNDHALPAVKLAPGASVVRVDVAADLIGNGPVKVELDLAGRARPSFVAALRGFTTDVARRDRDELRIARQELSRPAPIVRGRPLAVGFTALAETPADAWKNGVTELAVGGLCEVAFTAFLGREAANYDDSDPYELSIPLPAGTELLPGSVAGDFVAWAARPGSLEFRVLRTQGWLRVSFTLVGRLPGDWRALPPEIRSAVDLDRGANGDAWSIRVLPRGATPGDPYRPTPDELLDTGKRRYEADDLVGATLPLEQLVLQFGTKLRDPVQREVARMLLFCALRSGDAARVVRQFEIVKEKDPDLELAGESVRQVAAAYRALEEPEPALELTRALIDETFARDLRLPALLVQAARQKEAFALRERLWLDYPDTPAVKQSYLALSDEMLRLAPRALEDAALRKQGLDTKTLEREGMRVLMRFLAHSPADPLAPEAGLALVSAWLELDNWEQAASLSERLARRFPEPRFSDSFLYSKAVAEWSLGHDDAAKTLLERIAAAEYVEAGGKRVPSKNRELAWYILAQIHHARRDADGAARYYEKVAGGYPDAREALQGLRERRLELPEVTTARPGEKAALAITAKNLDHAELLVYPVDLLTLCLRQRNLSGIAGVELAGIAPVARLSVDLAKATHFEPRPTTVALDLPQAGAYLVLARADEHHASGLVLVTPLELQVKEDAGGRVRVHVQEAVGGKFLRDVDVRVIGSRDEAFVAGTTDPRGLFVAEEIDGAATIIARSGDRAYAFWRGTRELGGEPTHGKKQKNEPGAPDERGRSGEDYLKNIRAFNDDLQQQRQQQVEEEVQNAGRGIKVNQKGQ